MASESIEMYLVRTAMLRKGTEPVPLSLLAQWLEVSPASANEMCRKLAEQGLVMYQPYKGVTLTEEGECLAGRVLKRRRMWKTFLTERLAVDVDEAEDVACRLEHVTSDELVERLATYMQQPAASEDPPAAPEGSPAHTLATLAAGQHAQVVRVAADPVVQNFLQAQGIAPGVVLHIYAVAADGALLLAVPAGCITLAPSVASHVHVTLLAAEPEAPQNGGHLLPL
jgi:DtxR family Mn-dependent transcriptional regulator